mgnify:CR=1 FL=1
MTLYREGFSEEVEVELALFGEQSLLGTGSPLVW